MTPELKKVRFGVLILTFAWLLQAILTYSMLYKHARQAEALQARLEELEAKMTTTSTK